MVEHVFRVEWVPRMRGRLDYLAEIEDNEGNEEKSESQDDGREDQPLIRGEKPFEKFVLLLGVKGKYDPLRSDNIGPKRQNPAEKEDVDERVDGDEVVLPVSVGDGEGHHVERVGDAEEDQRDRRALLYREVVPLLDPEARDHHHENEDEGEVDGADGVRGPGGLEASVDAE